MSNSQTSISYLAYGSKVNFNYPSTVDGSLGLEVTVNDITVTNYDIDEAERRIIFNIAPTGTIFIIGTNFTTEYNGELVHINNSDPISSVLGDNNSDLLLDAWGRQKVYLDKSLFSSLFTYDIPVKLWKELDYNGTEYIEKSIFEGVTSINSALTLYCGTAERRQVRSQEHIRYQANRGLLYSAALFLDNPNANLTRRWGLILPCNGLFFELIGNGTSFIFNFVVRSNEIETRYDITDKIPSGFDFNYGNLFDFNAQIRGVGDFGVFLNQKRIFKTPELGKRIIANIENPSLSAGFEIIKGTEDEPIRCTCVDITSEGGSDISAKIESFTTGLTMVTLDTIVTSVLAIRLPNTINYNGKEVCFTVDSLLQQVTTFCKDEAVTAIYGARGINIPNIAALTFDTKPSTKMEFLIGGESSLLDTAFQLDINNLTLIKAVRQEKDFSNAMNNPSPGISPFIITADSYIIVAIDPDGATTAGCTIEIAEQI